MELNELLHAHQAEVTAASAAQDEEERQEHLDQVAEIAKLIGAYRAARILKAGIAPISAETAGSGTGAGDGSNSQIPRVSEDGLVTQSTKPSTCQELPRIRPRYFVGDEEYSDLKQAVEAHSRQSLALEKTEAQSTVVIQPHVSLPHTQIQFMPLTLKTA